MAKPNASPPATAPAVPMGFLAENPHSQLGRYEFHVRHWSMGAPVLSRTNLHKTEPGLIQIKQVGQTIASGHQTAQL